MKSIYKKITAFLLISVLLTGPVSAKTNVKMIGETGDNFTLKYQDLPDNIQIRITEAKTIPDVVVIPEGSTINLEVIKAQKELRWHKSGFILCKLNSYTLEETEFTVDLSQDDIYVIVRKYEPIDTKEAIFIGTELVLAQGASFFAPGVDIAYYFVKGAIQRKKDPHWFKAGVHNAYDNSICWFWLKGKPIELEEGMQVSVKDVPNKKVEKLKIKIDKRAEKQNIKTAKRLAKKDIRALKKELKNERKMVNCQIVEDGLSGINIDRNSIAEQ